MNDKKVTDKYNLLEHLPKHQRKFIISQHPGYLLKLTAEYEAKIKQAMNTPPGVYQKFNEHEAKRDNYNKLQQWLKEEGKLKSD